MIREVVIIMLRDLGSPGVMRSIDGGSCTERCPGYWSADGTVSRGTAVRAWQLVVEILDLRKIKATVAMKRGYRLRHLNAGQRRGAHWSSPPGAAELAHAVVSSLNVDVRKPRSTHVADGYLATVTPRGKRQWIMCPSHDDHHPSALVNAPRWGQEHGTIYCFVCRRTVALCHADRGLLTVYPMKREGPFTGQLAKEHQRSAQDLQPSARVIKLAGNPGIMPRLSTRGGGRRTVGFERADGTSVLPWTVGYVITTIGRHSVQQRYSSCRDLLDVLRSADRRASGPAAERHAMEGHYAYTQLADDDDGRGRRAIPDRLISLDMQGWSSLKPIRVSSDATAMAPQDFRPRLSRWIGVDLDAFDTEALGKGWAERMGENIRQWAESSPHTSGRIGIIQTSHRGLQVVLELADPRWDPVGWYANAHVVGWLAQLDTVCLAAAQLAGRRGGHADTAMHTHGRSARLPGPRITKDGLPHVVRLVYATP